MALQHLGSHQPWTHWWQQSHLRGTPSQPLPVPAASGSSGAASSRPPLHRPQSHRRWQDAEHHNKVASHVVAVPRGSQHGSRLAHRLGGAVAAASLAAGLPKHRCWRAIRRRSTAPGTRRSKTTRIWRKAFTADEVQGASNALAALVALDVAIILHEAGHFFCARTVGLPVEEFSVGLGPRIVGQSTDGTNFVLRLLPIGGYVLFDDRKSFDALPVGQKLWVLAGGVGSNILTAWAAVCGAALTVGIPKLTVLPGMLVTFVPREAAERTRLQAGDVILQLGSLDLTAPGVSESSALSYIRGLPAGTSVEAVVMRGTEELRLALLPFSDQQAGVQRLGINVAANVKPAIEQVASLPEACGVATATVTGILSDQVSALQRLITGSDVGGAVGGDFTGPIGIIEEGGRMVETQGQVGLIFFFASLSLNLAILNSLPVPGLDGGKAAIVVIEQAIGKEVNKEAKFALELTFALSIFATSLGIAFQDVSRLVDS